jgi:hypothetical protein
MCAVFKRERAVHDTRGPASGRAPAVHWVEEERDWSVEAPCEHCGGYRMPLQVRDPEHGRLAESRAEAFLTRIHSRGGCLGCEARTWRSGDGPATGDPHVWWDTDTGQWMAWAPMPGSDASLSLPLGIRTFWAPQEVRAAARAIWSGGRLPLRVASEPDGVDPDASTIFYDVESGRWRLRTACFDCGGFEIGLTSFGRGAVEAACDEAMSCLDLVAREDCPHCRTKRERGAQRAEDQEPRIWFDTIMRDWLVWQPLEDFDAGVTLPLGIGRYDARRAVVYRAAAALLFDSQQFHDEEL